MDLLSDFTTWIDTNIESGSWCETGNVDLHHDVMLSESFEKYREMLVSLGSIHLQSKPDASLGYSQVEIINVIVRLLMPLLFRFSYETNSEIIHSMLRCPMELPMGVILILSRRCGKSTVIAHIAVNVCKHFGYQTFQLFARTEDQSAIIAQLGANLLRGKTGELPDGCRITKTSITFKGAGGSTSTMSANPATDVIFFSSLKTQIFCFSIEFSFFFPSPSLFFCG
jgi:hypothetical protein